MSGPVDDPVLGHLTWDKEFNWWTGEVELGPGERVGLIVEADPAAATPEPVLARARAWVDRFRERADEYTRWTAEHVLDARWNKDTPMTLDGLIDLLDLAAVECFPDGTANILWEDGNALFFGHGLITLLDPAGNCVKVEVQ